MKNSVTAFGISLVLLGGLGPAFGAGGKREETPAVPKSTDQLAVEHYNNGLGHRDRAASYEKKAAGSEPEKAEKLALKAEKEYLRAIDEFRTALQNNPRMHQAFSDLGFVLRRSGNYADALDAYDQALALDPDYVPAIEYRGEAYLALDRLEDAKAAYEVLSRSDREQAATLVEAMQRWVEHRRVDPGDLDSGTIETFERWIESRDGLTTGHALPPSDPDRGW